MNNRIWRREKALIASLLEEYPHYEEYVAKRKFELTHPVSEIDENVGGGKAQNKPDNSVDLMLITLEEDHRLNELRREHYAIRNSYDEAPEEVQVICYELYFKPAKIRKYRTINDLCNASVIHVSKSVAYDEFDAFLHDVADQLELPR